MAGTDPESIHPNQRPCECHPTEHSTQAWERDWTLGSILLGALPSGAFSHPDTILRWLAPKLLSLCLFALYMFVSWSWLLSLFWCWLKTFQQKEQMPDHMAAAPLDLGPWAHWSAAWWPLVGSLIAQLGGVRKRVRGTLLVSGNGRLR